LPFGARGAYNCRMTLFIVVLIGFGVGYVVGRRATNTDPRREQVLALFGSGPEVSNDTVETALGVSDATATRMLDELEKSGDIVQVGDTGRGVTYRLK